MKKIAVSDLRSQRWYNSPAMRTFNHRSRTFQIGYSKSDFENKPVIAIVNTWSDFNQCHSHFKQRVEDVKRGVWQAGGFPIEVPAISLSEPMMKPTTMLYRNLLAMEAEEVLRAYPVDGAVLMGGCDKTTPGLLMGALQHEPAVHLRAGRADAHGALARQDPGQRQRQLEVLGRAARRQHHRGRSGRTWRSRSRARPATA